MSLKETLDPVLKLQPSLKQLIAIGCGGLVVIFVLHRVGRFDLARPLGFSLATMGVLIAVKWQWRRRVWFWAFVAGIAAINLAVIALVPWTKTPWVPPVVQVPIMLAELAIVLTIMKPLEKHFEERRPWSVDLPPGR
jgi:hypothetical protein